MHSRGWSRMRTYFKISAQWVTHRWWTYSTRVRQGEQLASRRCYQHIRRCKKRMMNKRLLMQRMMRWMKKMNLTSERPAAIILIAICIKRSTTAWTNSLVVMPPYLFRTKVASMIPSLMLVQLQQKVSSNQTSWIALCPCLLKESKKIRNKVIQHSETNESHSAVSNLRRW